MTDKKQLSNLQNFDLEEKFRDAVDKISHLSIFLEGFKRSKGCINNEMQAQVQSWIDALQLFFDIYDSNIEDSLESELPSREAVGKIAISADGKSRLAVADSLDWFSLPDGTKLYTQYQLKGILKAINNSGFTLIKTQYGYELQKLDKIYSQTTTNI